MRLDPTELKGWFNAFPVVREGYARCDEIGVGSARLSMHPPDRLRNPNGAVNGSLLAAFADQAGGLAVATTAQPGEYQSTLDLQLHYLRAAFKTPLTAVARVVRRGGHHCWVQIEISDPDGNLCTMASGSWVIQRNSPNPTIGATQP